MEKQSYFARARAAAAARPKLPKRCILRTRKQEYQAMLNEKTWVPFFGDVIKFSLIPWTLFAILASLQYFVFAPLTHEEICGTWMLAFQFICELVLYFDTIISAILVLFTIFAFPIALVGGIYHSIKFLKSNPKSAYPKKIYVSY